MSVGQAWKRFTELEKRQIGVVSACSPSQCMGCDK